MAILCCVAQKAASAAQRQQNLGVDKKLAQMQKSPLTVWLGRVHSCWLLPDLAEDILRFPDGVALFHAVAKCGVASGRPAFMGGLSPVLYQLIVPARHAENVTNFGADKILASA
jgi:hypothetical protein